MPDQNSVFIAFFLPPAIAEQIALPDGQPADRLHLTLAFLGAADKLDLNQLEEGLALWAKREIPITGRINGLGRFTETSVEGQHAFYASFDAPRLAQFRQNLVGELAWMGFPANQAHGYTPHITLQFLAAGDPSPLTGIAPIEITFDTLTLAIGDRRVEYQLTGAPTEKSQTAEKSQLSGSQAPGHWTRFAKIESVNEEEQTVYGIASTETPDAQGGVWEGKRYEGDIVTIEAIEKALPDYLKWSNIREMHQNSAVGKTLEAEIKDRQLHIGIKVVDKGAWEKVREQVYRGFSIGGDVIKAVLVEIGGKIYRKILELKLYEISLVDRPANGDAAILLWKFNKQEDNPMPDEKTPAAEAPAAEEKPKDAKSKDAKVVQMLQQLRDECETNKDMAGAGRYSQAIALMIGEQEAEEPVQAAEGVPEGEQPEEQPVQAGQKPGKLQKSAKPDAAKPEPAITVESLTKAIQPAFDGLTEILKGFDARLANIEAQPSPGGPALRPVNKSIAGQNQPQPNAGEPAVDIAELRRKASTEPNPILKAEYGRQLVIAEQALAKK
jgi:2'-5' RNA ligase